MDGLRRSAGLVWVTAGSVFQLWWLVVEHVVPGAITLALCGAAVVLAAAVLVGSFPVTRVAATVMAVALAFALGGAVADRFGVFGGPGSGGVSWGSWSVFVDYTARLLPGAADRVAPVAAVAATVVEVVLSVLLLSGWQRRWVAKTAAGLLVVYLVTMLWSVGAGEVARYGVPVLVGGALLLSSSGAPAGRLAGADDDGRSGRRPRPLGLRRGVGLSR